MGSPYDHQSDELIWNFFKDGNKEAFSALYYRFFKLLIQNGLRITSDKDLVKDCIHDLFVEIWKNKLKLATPDSVEAYLVSSSKRKIIRQLVKLRHRQTELERVPYVNIVHSTEEQLIADQIADEKQHSITIALDCLTKRQKEAVYLKFYSNLDYSEIAQKMSISRDSIYNLISKAIDSLQIKLTKMPESSINQI